MTNKDRNKMNILIGCECSQTVCKAFRERGHNAFSCDIEPCYGGKPEWHILGDCREYIYGDVNFYTQNGDEHYVQQFDIIIAHPKKRAIDFFLLFKRLRCRWCIENPPGLMSKLYRKPDQTIQPFWFGDCATKAMCLWLHGLPLLEKTKVVEIPAPSKLPRKDRAKSRSKTFDGIANAMAQQWGNIDNIVNKQKELNF